MKLFLYLAIGNLKYAFAIIGAIALLVIPAILFEARLEDRWGLPLQFAWTVIVLAILWAAVEAHMEHKRSD